MEGLSRIGSLDDFENSVVNNPKIWVDGTAPDDLPMSNVSYITHNHTHAYIRHTHTHPHISDTTTHTYTTRSHTYPYITH